MAKFYLRCFRSNPTKGDDGVWRARQSVDISMGVMSELEPKLLETLARGIQHNLNNELGNADCRRRKPCSTVTRREFSAAVNYSKLSSNSV